MYGIPADTIVVPGGRGWKDIAVATVSEGTAEELPQYTYAPRTPFSQLLLARTNDDKLDSLLLFIDQKCKKIGRQLKFACV